MAPAAARVALRAGTADRTVHCRPRWHRGGSLHAPHLWQGSALRAAADIWRGARDRGGYPPDLGHARLCAARAAGAERRLHIPGADLVDVPLLCRGHCGGGHRSRMAADREDALRGHDQSRCARQRDCARAWYQPVAAAARGLRARHHAGGIRRHHPGAHLGHTSAHGRGCRRAGVPHHRPGRGRELLGRRHGGHSRWPRRGPLRCLCLGVVAALHVRSAGGRLDGARTRTVRQEKPAGGVRGMPARPDAGRLVTPAMIGLWLVLASVPLWIGKVGLYPYIGVEILIWSIYALAFNLVLGTAGLPSFGHGAYFGVGAYAFGLSQFHLAYNLWICLGVALMTAGLAGLIVGLFISHRRGIYFAFLTIAFGQIFWTIAIKWHSITGGEDGLLRIARLPADFGLMSFDLTNNVSFYYFVLAVFVVIVIALWRLTHSPYGRVLAAIRQSETRAAHLGYKVWFYK